MSRVIDRADPKWANALQVQREILALTTDDRVRIAFTRLCRTLERPGSAVIHDYGDPRTWPWDDDTCVLRGDFGVFVTVVCEGWR